MKKKIILIFSLILQLFLVFSFIYYKSSTIQIAFDNQKYKKEKLRLINKKAKLEDEIGKFSNKQNIKYYALSKLKFEPVKLSNIKKLNKEFIKE